MYLFSEPIKKTVFFFFFFRCDPFWFQEQLLFIGYLVDTEKQSWLLHKQSIKFQVYFNETFFSWIKRFDRKTLYHIPRQKSHFLNVPFNKYFNENITLKWTTQWTHREKKRPKISLSEGIGVDNTTEIKSRFFHNIGYIFHANYIDGVYYENRPSWYLLTMYPIISHTRRGSLSSSC